jgi:nucleoside-diphosphate kinase
MKQRTLTFIKPESVEEGHVGEIISIIEKAGFKIISSRMAKLTKEEACKFYNVHKDKDFFEELTDYASSGVIFLLCIEKENAIEDLRQLIGDTDPEKSEEGTIRKLYGHNIRKNAIHASDSLENALKEISFFFSEIDLF